MARNGAGCAGARFWGWARSRDRHFAHFFPGPFPVTSHHRHPESRSGAPKPTHDRIRRPPAFAGLSGRVHPRRTLGCDHLPAYRSEREGDADYRSRDRADCRRAGRTVGRTGLPVERVCAGGSCSAPAGGYARGGAGGHGDLAGVDLRGAGAGQRAALADADDGRGEPPPHAPRAHGEHQPGDHVPGDAGGLQPGGPAQPKSAGTGAQGKPHPRDDGGGDGYHRGNESRLQVVQDFGHHLA